MWWRFSGIRQPLSLSPHACGDGRSSHLRKETSHEGGSLESRRLGQVASEIATGFVHPTKGVDCPKASGLKKIHSTHGPGFRCGTVSPAYPHYT